MHDRFRTLPTIIDVTADDVSLPPQPRNETTNMALFQEFLR